MPRTTRRHLRAFTLIELLLVVVMLGVLTALTIPRLAQSGGDAQRSVCRANIQRINAQIESWAVVHDGRYPADHDEFVAEIMKNPALFPDGPPECPYGSEYRYDPSTNRVRHHLHPTTASAVSAGSS